MVNRSHGRVLKILRTVEVIGYLHPVIANAEQHGTVVCSKLIRFSPRCFNRRSFLLIEQNANAALRCTDQACVLETSRVAMSGTGEALLADQRGRDTYLGSTASEYKESTGGGLSAEGAEAEHREPSPCAHIIDWRTGCIPSNNSSG